jgi:hypothetical protein
MMKKRMMTMSDPNYNPGDRTTPHRALDGNYITADGKAQTYALNLPMNRCGFTPEQQSAITRMIRKAVDEAIASQPSNAKPSNRIGKMNRIEEE